MSGISEADWKILSKLKPLALDRLCSRILEKATVLAHREEGAAHTRYLRLYEYMHGADKSIARSFDDWSRSTALMKLAIWHQERLITDDEFLQLSETTRAQVNTILSVSF